MVFNVVLGASCKPCLRTAVHVSPGMWGRGGSWGIPLLLLGDAPELCSLGGFMAGASPAPFLFLNLNSNPIKHWGSSIKENKKIPIFFLFSWCFVAFLIYFAYLTCAVSSHLQILIFNLPPVLVTVLYFKVFVFPFLQCHWIIFAFQICSKTVSRPDLQTRNAFPLLNPRRKFAVSGCYIIIPSW